MLNSVALIGRLGSDPELKYLPSGDAVVNFTMATSENWKDKNGNKQESTEWHRVVAFKKLAEIINQYLGKGSLIYVQGKIKTRSWDDKEGKKHYSTEIHVNEMKMLSSNKDQGIDNKKTDVKKDNSDFGGTNYSADDIPF